MGSIDVNGSEVAYQAQYEAYTEAASQDDAAVYKLKVENPTAGQNGALACIVMPNGKNAYLYMDAGALAVMRFDGSEYKKFKADYELKKGTTYTLCVFQDGLVFFDGVNCYKYSGDFYGFTDVAAGWSDESNVFSVSLEKTSAAEPDTSDREKTDDTEEAPVQETAASTSEVSFPSVWIILAMLLAVTSNLVALAALRTSNIALRAIRPYRQRTSGQPAASSAQRNAPPKAARQRSTSQRMQQQKRQPAPQSRPQRPTANPHATAAKKKPVVSLFDQEKMAQQDAKPQVRQDKKQKPAPQAPARKPGTLAQPFDLYLDPYWRANPGQFMPYRFGSLNRGYCTFERGDNLSCDPFVLLGGDYIWLNPVRFHLRAQGQGVRISVTECSELSMVFDFCHVGTGVREIALSVDVEMVNFRPALVKKSSGGVWELEQRGIIVFE